MSYIIEIEKFVEGLRSRLLESEASPHFGRFESECHRQIGIHRTPTTHG